MLRFPSARGPNSIRPSNHPTILLIRQQVRDALREARSLKALVPGANGVEVLRNPVVGECRPEAGALHGVPALINGARLLELPVPDELCHAQCATGIAGGRLNPEPLEWSLAEDPAVADAVERHAPREAEIIQARFPMRRARHAEHHLFAHRLDRPGQVHLLLGQPRLRFTGRTAKELVEGLARHGEAREIVEVLLVEPEGAVLPEVHQFLAGSDRHTSAPRRGRVP